jgi:hypothetical protein
MHEFEELLFKYGLIQFGRFANPDGTTQPFKLNLDWLSSYPGALEAAAKEITYGIDLHNIKVERILCPFDTLPLATLVSQKTKIPLVYSRGRGEPPVVDLVGAYDINHPTLFLVNAYLSNQSHTSLLKNADRVGLKTKHAYALVDAGNPTMNGNASVGWADVLTIDALAELALHRGEIIENMYNIVQQWYFAGLNE